MAAYTANIAKTVTTVAAQVDSIALSGTGRTLQIVTTAGTTPTYFTITAVGLTAATPTSGGDDVYVALAANEISIPWNGSGIGIKLINSAIATVTFQLLP